MNKTELIDKIAERAGVSKKDVGAVIDGLFVEVSHVVAKGDDKVTIPGFVSFEQVDRKARKGFNPQTGEPITIEASTAVKVTAGNKLKAYARGTEAPPN
ncbi:MAG: HU family DNA-binding protein [Actinomycetota bacterium]